MFEALQLSKVYRKTTALDNVSFQLQPGECLGIAGHNGSGKSTLLSLVSQTAIPTSGKILWQGSNIMGNKAFMRHNVGYAPQNSALLEDLTVRETLLFWHKIYKVDSSSMFADSSPASLLGIESFKQKKISQLSGGMKKRLSISLALLHNPKILIMDEAYAALDRQYQIRLTYYLQNYLKQGNCMLFCSHSLEELTRLSSHLLVLQNGKPVFYDLFSQFPTDAESLNYYLNPKVN